MELGRGIISPQLAFGMARNLTENNGVRPWLTVDLIFDNDFNKSQLYVLDGTNWVDGAMTINNSDNSMRTDIALGLGGFAFANNNGWRTSADIDYLLQITSWNNEYNYNSTDTTSPLKVASYAGRNAGGGFAELGRNDHRIRPSIWTAWNGENLRLRGRFELPLNFSNRTSTAKVIDYNTSGQSADGALRNEGLDSSTFIFSIVPAFYIAAQWQIGSKFFLNMGGLISTTAITYTKATAETYGTVNGVAGQKN
jgi:hypothetical protein